MKLFKQFKLYISKIKLKSNINQIQLNEFGSSRYNIWHHLENRFVYNFHGNFGKTTLTHMKSHVTTSHRQPLHAQNNFQNASHLKRLSTLHWNNCTYRIIWRNAHYFQIEFNGDEWDVAMENITMDWSNKMSIDKYFACRWLLVGFKIARVCDYYLFALMDASQHVELEIRSLLCKRA